MRKLLFIVTAFVVLSCSKDEIIKEVQVEIPEVKQEVEVKYIIKTNDYPFTIEYGIKDGSTDPYIYGVHGTDLDWEHSFTGEEGGLLYLYYYSKNQPNEDTDKELQVELTVYVNNKIFYHQKYINYHNVSGSVAAVIPTVEEIKSMDQW